MQPKKKVSRPVKRVKLYTTTSCPWCKAAKAYFRDNDIEFVEVDIVNDLAGRREMVTMTGQYGVPVVLVGHKTLVGWNPGEFERLWRA